MKRMCIIIFTLFIFLVFSFILLLSIPWFFAYQHQAIAFLGIFLIMFTIPIIAVILLKKSIKKISIIYYLFYFVITGMINIISSGIIQEKVFYKFNFKFNFSQFFNPMMIYLLLLFFSFQFPIIFLCIIIKKLIRHNNDITLKYFLKDPLIYVFICSLFIFPFIFFIL
jgi:hypothetical protein